MRRVVIFEALSFIGFQLVDTLLNEGIEVIGIDEIDSERKEEMLFSIGRNSNFELASSYEQEKKTQLCIGCFYEQMTMLSSFKKCEQFGIPMVMIFSKENVKMDMVGEKILIENVYGPWRQKGLAGIDKETAIYVDDIITYILSICHAVIEKMEINTTLKPSIPFDIGKKKVEEHMQKFNWLYRG
ncbi:MAG: hypothetical protein ACI35O_13835 [Bacillaceae bacterium]